MLPSFCLTISRKVYKKSIYEKVPPSYPHPEFLPHPIPQLPYCDSEFENAWNVKIGVVLRVEMNHIGSAFHYLR